MGRNTLDDAEKKRSRKTERALELLARLCEAYPQAFVARGTTLRAAKDLGRQQHTV